METKLIEVECVVLDIDTPTSRVAIAAMVSSLPEYSVERLARHGGIHYFTTEGE